MSSKRSKAISMIFVLGMIVLSLWLVFYSNDWDTVIATAGALRSDWLTAAFGCWAMHVMMDAFILWFQLRKQHAISYWYALYVTVLGSFYCAVTPGASGGQPMQVYYLSKRKVPIGVSTSALSVKFVIGQASTVLITLILWFTSQSMLSGRLASLRWLIILGWLVHLCGVVLIVMITFCKATVHKLADWLIRCGAKLRLIKDPAAAAQKVHHTIDSHHANVRKAGQHPVSLLFQILVASFSLLLIMLVPFCLYHAFGLSAAQWPELVTTAYMLYLSASYNPLPGASGAQEGGFLAFFQGIFPPGEISMAMFMWRFFTYYLHLIAGALLMLVRSLHCILSLRRRR